MKISRSGYGTDHGPGHGSDQRPDHRPDHGPEFRRITYEIMDQIADRIAESRKMNRKVVIGKHVQNIYCEFQPRDDNLWKPCFDMTHAIITLLCCIRWLCQNFNWWHNSNATRARESKLTDSTRSTDDGCHTTNNRNGEKFTKLSFRVFGFSHSFPSEPNE